MKGQSQHKKRSSDKYVVIPLAIIKRLPAWTRLILSALIMSIRALIGDKLNKTKYWVQPRDSRGRFMQGKLFNEDEFQTKGDEHE